jgi:hypothetical protein
VSERVGVRSEKAWGGGGRVLGGVGEWLVLGSSTGPDEGARNKLYTYGMPLSCLCL